MRSPYERVASLVEQGRVSANDGRILLDAMKAERRKPLYRWLFDPFDDLSMTHGSVAIGIAVLLQMVTSRFGIRYDGPLDLHVGSTPGWTTTVAEIVLDFGLVNLLAWGTARLFTARSRPFDVLVAIAVARIPLILASLPLGWFGPDPETVERQVLAGELPWTVVVLGLLTLPLMGWHLVLWFRGYRTATGLAGAPLWGAFLSTLVISELLAEIVLANL